MSNTFRFIDDKLNKKLLALLTQKKINHVVGNKGEIIYASEDEELIEDKVINYIRDSQFKDWQILSFPKHWLTRYQNYMDTHKVPYVLELIDGHHHILLPAKYRPHSWKLEADKPRTNEQRQSPYKAAI